MAVAVISSTGMKLMPTSNYKARKLMKSGRAKIFRYSPFFTIQLLDREEGATQEIEYKCDTGYQHIGISICSQKHEYVNEQRDLLVNEVEKHNDSRKYRRTRRDHLRYRKPRFDNRVHSKKKGWFAPSLRNKRDQHVMLYKQYSEVLPVTSSVFEMGQFDTQVLKAIELGAPIPEGKDYQRGERYKTETLRMAVFTRDNHTCIVCKKPGILHAHHIGFWKCDRTSRMGNLATVCEKCHTPKNHKPGGKLYGLEPKLKPLTGATFMTSVRWSMLERLKEAVPGILTHVTYGAATKLSRKDLGLKKTHSNDAYAMGIFHPAHRTDAVCYEKRRRNNRVLEKFYDAVYVDIRTGKRAKGAQIGCNRTKRRESRTGSKNERIYRGKCLSKGRRSIRRKRYPIQSGDRIIFENKKYTSGGCQHYGEYVTLRGRKNAPSVNKVVVLYHAGGWVKQK